MSMNTTSSVDLDKLHALLADDSYAMSFQSMGQYRTAVLKEIELARRTQSCENPEHLGMRLARVAKAAGIPAFVDWSHQQLAENVVTILGEIARSMEKVQAAHAVCTLPPPGWYCTRARGHDGPCAAHPATGEHDHSEGGHAD
jgi:hypothetical protein